VVSFYTIILFGSFSVWPPRLGRQGLSSFILSGFSLITYTSHYNLTDHPSGDGQALGNVQVTFNETGTVIQAEA
jgi:hypothetical protein